MALACFRLLCWQIVLAKCGTKVNLGTWLLEVTCATNGRKRTDPMTTINFESKRHVGKELKWPRPNSNGLQPSSNGL